MRPRKKDRHLPPCVHFRHGAFYLVKNGKWTHLGADLSQALAEYGRRIAAPKGGMVALIDAALADASPHLAKSTRDQYRIAAGKLKHMFADLTPQAVTSRHVVQMRRMLRDTPNMANRCLSVLRTVFDYALEEQLVDFNPATGVKRLHEHTRDRLIRFEEFTSIYEKAGPRLRIIMAMLYLTGQRVMDVMQIKLTDLLDEGIAFKQQKTGARLVVRWTLELKTTVADALALRTIAKAPTLIHNRRGKAPDYSTVKLQWNQACAAAGVKDADMRDIRAMSGTATDDQGKNATGLLGHATPAMTKRYLRGRKVPHVDGPSFGQIVDTGQKDEQN